MAEIVLNVEVRERTGTGGARSVRNKDMVPGILYGGDRGPVPIAVNTKDFRKSLYTGKLLGHLVTLKYGDETQPVIARDIQFHPVTDMPIHFDLMRVDEHATITIEVAVHFKNQDICQGLKRGGTLNIVRHSVELAVPADHIPEELVVDLKGLDIGDTIRASALKLPKDAKFTVTDRDFVIATIAGYKEADIDGPVDGEEAVEAAAEGAEEAAEGEAAAGDAEAKSED
ncbi:MAG TPA: 50S ribosomal protein L25/general stress protein Ctc [Caulobacteraceae bacterium]|nr:50S ribosomal protein L25/general stress protein Ctc [Caulobacteraceae bacterium]